MGLSSGILSILMCNPNHIHSKGRCLKAEVQFYPSIQVLSNQTVAAFSLLTFPLPTLLSPLSSLVSTSVEHYDLLETADAHELKGSLMIIFIRQNIKNNFVR